MSAASPGVGCLSTFWGRMILCCLGAVWSSRAGLTRCSLGENCAGGDDDGDWGECTRWDECDLGLVLDVGFLPVGLIDSKMMRSSLNVTLFLVFSLGVLKGVNVVTSGRNLSCGLRRVLEWCSVVTQWLQVSSVSPVLFTVRAFDYVWASSFQNFYHCPCQPL